MKSISQPLIILIALLTAVTACYWDNEETLYGDVNTQCNPVGSSYVQNVVPILNYNCNGCHSTESAASMGDNIILDDYNILQTYVNNGRLMGSINHSSGYEAMPKSAAKLSTCDILALQTWIDNGAKND